ncbi:resistance to lethality of mkk1p386 overexpression [Collariella sp. IMI 366227]|nr:resistance to lethality of mkk1p386 overexpression [Collariella sp. IMI 366227]
MGRRKIEIKPIKDERNRSVTFLKRKGGLFKKAYELSELCSVDVAVIIFSHNNKLHQFSSREMRDLVYRWNCHGAPNENKGPADFNGGPDEEEEDEEQGTPPQAEPLDSHMLPRHLPGQPHFHIVRNQTASASPPIPNGTFGSHPGGSHTPQPQMGSRPSSRNDIRRMGPNMQLLPPPPPPPQQQQEHVHLVPQIMHPPHGPQQSAPMGVKQEPVERARQPLLLNTNIKKQAPRQQGGSIFTPIENPSVLGQHLAAFGPAIKSESPGNRGISRGGNSSSPPSTQRSQVQLQLKKNMALGPVPDTIFTPPSRSNSVLVSGNPSRPRLKVQIPDESDGAPQQNNMHIDTPASALLPSRALHGDLLPSPSGFYADWAFRGSDSNTTLSPMNLTFATPIGPSGPSFLNDLAPPKRKSPEIGGDGGAHESLDAGNEAKRARIEH